MAPKKTRDITSAAATAQASTTAPASTTPQPKPSSQGQNAIVTWFQTIQQYYVKETPQRTKLIDVFLVFLVAVGAVQFLYCVLAGNYVRHHQKSKCPVPIPLLTLFASPSTLFCLVSV